MDYLEKFKGILVFAEEQCLYSSISRERSRKAFKIRR